MQIIRWLAMKGVVFFCKTEHGASWSNFISVWSIPFRKMLDHHAHCQIAEQQRMGQFGNSQLGPKRAQKPRYETSILAHLLNGQSRKEEVSAFEELELEQKSDRQRRATNYSQGGVLVVESKHQFFQYYSAGIGIDHHGMQILASVRWEKLKKLCVDWNK